MVFFPFKRSKSPPSPSASKQASPADYRVYYQMAKELENHLIYFKHPFAGVLAQRTAHYLLASGQEVKLHKINFAMEKSDHVIDLVSPHDVLMHMENKFEKTMVWSACNILINTECY